MTCIRLFCLRRKDQSQRCGPKGHKTESPDCRGGKRSRPARRWKARTAGLSRL